MYVSKRMSDLFLVALLGATTFTASARAQTDEKQPKLPWPTESASWVNSPPLSLEALSGKGAVLWFYEEDCPKCRAKWPDMMALAKKFDGQPVVFIAINSGNPRPAVQQYVRQCRINWPVIVDTSRELERAAGVKEISLKNIHQAKILTPEGELQNASWKDLEAAANKALKGAVWRIDPSDIPASLQPAWRAIETKSYVGAGPLIKRYLASSDAETKAAAEKLMAAVQPEIEADLAEAKSKLDAGDKLGALAAYNSINQRFAGFDLPLEAAQSRKDLITDPQVKAAIKAEKDLEMVKRVLARSKAPAVRSRAILTLKQIVKDATGTDTAAEAEALLKQVESSAN